MAYSSKGDAISKLTNGYIDNDSFQIFTSDSNYDLNTIFYTNSAKTILLSAGNYVLPTNYRTLWIVIGSNGKMTQLPELLITTDTDASFADDSWYSMQTLSRYDFGQFDAQLSSDILTDYNWANFPNRQWVVNFAGRSTSPITNINLSEMKGYDLYFYAGEYDTSNRFSGPFGGTFFVHIKQDITRNTIISESGQTKIYFLKPDYWFTKNSINRTTFFKRNPYLLKLKNKRGLDKINSYADFYIFDILQTDRTTTRTSTRKNRGLHIDNWVSWTLTQVTGGYNTSAPTQVVKQLAVYQDPPNFLYQGTFFNLIWGSSYSGSLTDQYRLSALFRSMYLQDFSGSYQGISYASANPYQWTCAYNSGTGYQNFSPTNGMVDFMKDTTNSYNVGLWYWDMENSYDFNNDETSIFGLFKCLKNAKDYVVANNLSSQDTKVVWYSGGVYRTDGYFRNPDGSQPNTSNYTTSPYYLDYHNYYTGTANRSTLQKGYWKPFYDYAEYFQFSHVSNYLNDYNDTTYFYKMMMQYDISNKLISERLGANHQVGLASSNQHFYETLINNQSTMIKMRKAIKSTGEPALAKPDCPPDFVQSIAAWSFGYCDGALWFGQAMWELEDYANQKWDQINADPEYFRNDFGSAFDWYYATMFNLYQNRDIVEANTNWQYTSQLKSGGGYTTGTENYPITNWVFQRPLIAHKLNASGTEALVLAINPFNNGYTKSTQSINIFGTSITIDMYGTYTSVIRVKNS